MSDNYSEVLKENKDVLRLIEDTIQWFLIN